MSEVITRFPPSPTGYLHLGGARTAIFNWLYARRMKGRFVLRFEDTDTERSRQEYVDSILESLEWLGIDWDEGPHYQTRRFPVYREHIRKLLETGHAYYCTCPPERIEEMRQKALATGGKPKYDGTCRNRGLGPGEGAAVRFKAPLSGTTVLEDVVKGPIAFQNEELDDFIICRSDGSPTYNFAVVVDDITMGINTILRGDDHVMNTPKQIQLYHALGSPLPVFGHVPMVLGKDRARLSKRHGATNVTAYREMGILPEAMINYLVRLGWSHGDQEFFTRRELVEIFNLEAIGRAAGVFDPEKLLALNADHIKATPPAGLVPALTPFMQTHGVDIAGDPRTEKAIATLQPRSKTLKEMADQALFYFQDEVAYETEAVRKFLTADAIPVLERVRRGIEALADFTEAGLEGAFQAIMAETGLKLG
ncbi:MAG: glutamate--tRNA ligase, partial [Desulfobacterales bacterium]|nr:glutamate--tRNA ligase [Desulfobacterales bacterium]